MVKMTKDENGQIVQEVDPQVEKEREEMLRQTKRVVYPMYLLGFIVSGILWFAYEQQQRLIAHNAKKLQHQQRV